MLSHFVQKIIKLNFFWLMNNTQKIMYRIVLFVHIQRTNCMLKSIQLSTQKTHTILYTLTDQTKTTFSAESASLFNSLNNADTQKRIFRSTEYVRHISSGNDAFGNTGETNFHLFYSRALKTKHLSSS